MARIAVIGGTGTLGTALLKRLYTPGMELFCLSRCELKQDQIKHLATPVLCDVTDFGQVMDAIPDGCDAVFHVAALKRVDRLESEVSAAINTNLIGTINAVRASIDKRVPNFVFCTTDKAVEPLNAYGMTKALAEKYIDDQARRNREMKFSTFRWGNVLGSRGSVLDYFIDCAKNYKTVKITSTAMTRFWIDIDDAVNFMAENYQKGGKFTPPMKAAPVMDVVNAVFAIVGASQPDLDIVGLRPGEKLHECIYADANSRVRSNSCEQYSSEELVALIQKHMARSCA